MQCSNCGEDLLKGADFCGKCGTPAGSPIDSPSTSTTKTNFLDAISLGFRRYFEFYGRSTRAEYWWWLLFILAAHIGFGILNSIAGIFSALEGLFQLVTLIPGFALGARRLHDINRSGWWQLLWLGLVTGIVLLWWAAQPSDEGTNKYDPD